MASDSQVKILESHIRECFGRVAWSHKTQEKCADIVFSRNSTIKIIQIILSALTTTGVFTTVLGESPVCGIITGLISAALLALNTYVKGSDLGQVSQKHSDAANDLWDVRESYLALLTDINAGVINTDEIINRRDALQMQLKNIYEGTPRTISKAYKAATTALQVNEELTFSEQEIDKLLPADLRRGNQTTLS